jgi:membrane associated rhomboid family serine protease
MDGSQRVSLALPRPGPVLKAVLVAILALGLFNAFIGTWMPRGGDLFQALTCDLHHVRHGQVWRLVTSGLLTDPDHYSHLVFTLIGLYFLSPDLEKRWGARRFSFFLGASVFLGNLVVIAVDSLLRGDGHEPAGAAATLAHAGGRVLMQDRFHPEAVFGASAAIAAIAIAWARENRDRTVQLFFVLPVRGQWLSWMVIGFCVLDLIYPTALPEGVVAPFGGLATGFFLGGSPSPLRTAYLRLKLALLRRRSRSLGVAEVLSPQGQRRPRSGGKPLRVVSGGLEDTLRKRNPPKDKRYLN